METIIKVYDRDNYLKLINGVKVVQINKIHCTKEDFVTEVPKLEDLNISSTLCCSFCKINFEDCIQQRQHYKSDWHRYNLKLNLKSLEPISEEKFDQFADDVSSISGSDTENDDNSEQDSNINAATQGKIFFKNEDGKFFSMYRSLLHEKKDIPANDDVLLKLARQNLKNIYWVILMLGGGHFAGAVFNGSDILVHKTFHCYTVRAKQGGSQSSHDNKGGAKSAGASLRRYNEQALVQHVTNLIESWSSHIEKSNIIFYRAAGPYNRTVLFGRKNPILKKNDARLRNVPFSTKRPTFTEVKRVHDILTNVEVFSSSDSVAAQFTNLKPAEENNDLGHHSRRASPKNKNINRAKSRETKERPLPGAEEVSSDSENEEAFLLESENLELSLNDLKEYEDTVPLEVKKQKAAKKKKPKKKDRIKKWEENLKKELYKACSKGDLEQLKNVLHGIKDEVKEDDNVEITENSAQNGFLKAINISIDEHGNTPLHIAALNSKSDIILWLMENDATPCCKNDKQNTPYTINADKDLRNVFRKFASENPNKYNYAKSHIPVIVSTMTDEEIAEKKKAQRKIKREREKEKKKENDFKRKEEDERIRFVNLTDREKRALAAERRLLAQTSAVLVRCFLCGEDMSGKVPFEYSGNRFCSITCLKAHRMKTPVVLS